MKSHWEKFLEAYNQAPNKTRDFVDSHIMHSFLTKVIKKDNVDMSADALRDLRYAINLTLLAKKGIEELKPYTESLDWTNENHKKLYGLGVMLYLTEEDYKTYGSQSIDQRVRESVLKSANIKQQYLLNNKTAKEALNDLAINHDLLSEYLYKKLIITIEDIILGFYNIADTEPLLIQELGITPEAAQALTPDIIEFLAPLSDPNWQPPMDENEEYKAAATTDHEPSDTYITPEQPVVANETETNTETHTTAQPMRTMQQDMARSPQRPEFEPMADDTPVYTSEQPTNEHDVPAYTQPKQTARWDSEQE